MLKKLNAVLVTFGLCCSMANISLVFAASNVTGSQKIVVEGFDWGPAVTKTIISLDAPIDAVSASSFTVVERKLANDWTTFTRQVTDFDRIVTNAYTSDENGNAITGGSTYVTIEMKVDPDNGSPFIYMLDRGLNVWANPYELHISIANGQTLLSNGTAVTSLTIDPTPTAKIMPQADKFAEGSGTYDGINLSYASYAPSVDSAKNPLIIWLHGAGEGGSDPDIDLLGNRVTGLIDSNVQALFNGAYVLTPQSPTMWMDSGSGQYTSDGTSKYTTALMELINNYVTSNPDIDTDRIYIGGCSNGGFMTMKMILTYPQYFAAAFPICEAYSDSWITDDMLNGIKDLPIWFTHAKNDTTVNPTTTTVATYNRLLAMGAKNLHLSLFDDVHDTSGLYLRTDSTPYQYNGHWSWVYTLNNECIDNGVSIFAWLAQQTKFKETIVTPATTTSTSIVKTSDYQDTLSLTILLGLSLIVLIKIKKIANN